MSIIGVLVYQQIIKHEGVIAKIGQLELTFIGIITSMVGYLTVVIIYLNLVSKDNKLE